MKIKKTVGMTYTAKEHMAGERKSYCIITECGEEIECLAAGTQGFKCNGVKYKSLKAIKDMIESNDDREEWQCEPWEEESDDVSMNESGELWDCVHPCAFMVRMIKSHSPESLETLANYGWLNEDGTPDFAKADREFTRVENLKMGADDV